MRPFIIIARLPAAQWPLPLAALCRHSPEKKGMLTGGWLAADKDRGDEPAKKTLKRREEEKEQKISATKLGN